jgi:thiamine-phosphate pyrophosphorylase
MISSFVIVLLYHEEEVASSQEPVAGMIRCCITDRGLEGVGSLLLAGGVDWVQIRKKDLSGRELMLLVRSVMALPNPHSVKILVNSRVDIAFAAGAGGVHLPSLSIAPCEWKKITPSGFLIGVSCHSLEEVLHAETEGADYVLSGPVFSPLSKTSDLAPRGLEGLRKVTAAVRIPVLALGGVTWENAGACMDAGAAGVAGISLFKNVG